MIKFFKYKVANSDIWMVDEYEGSKNVYDRLVKSMNDTFGDNYINSVVEIDVHDDDCKEYIANKIEGLEQQIDMYTKLLTNS